MIPCRVRVRFLDAGNCPVSSAELPAGRHVFRLTAPADDLGLGPVALVEVVVEIPPQGGGGGDG